MSCHRIAVVFTIFFLFAAIGLLIASSLLTDWFQPKQNKDTAAVKYIGLWKVCEVLSTNTDLQQCTTDGGIFQFNSSRRDLDVVLVLNIASILFCVLGLVGNFVTIRSVICCDIMTQLMILIGSSCAIALMVYCEVIIIRGNNYARGCACYLAHGGMAAAAIATVFGFFAPWCHPYNNRILPDVNNRMPEDVLKMDECDASFLRSSGGDRFTSRTKKNGLQIDVSGKTLNCNTRLNYYQQISHPYPDHISNAGYQRECDDVGDKGNGYEHVYRNVPWSHHAPIDIFYPQSTCSESVE